MKRILLILSLALVLALSLVLFAPSADAAQYESPGTVVLYVGWPAYEKVYTFDIEEGYTWQDLASDCASLATEECRVQTIGDSVQLYLPDYGHTVPISSTAGTYQKPSDLIADASYVASLPVEFSIQAIVDGVPIGETYSFSLFAGSNTFADYAKHNIVFDGGTLGNCKFVVISDAVILRTGLSSVDGSYQYQYALCTNTSGKLVATADCVQSMKYYGMDVCTALKLHDFSSVDNEYYVEPTCKEGGSIWVRCKYCNYKELRELAPLGHNYNDAGVCKRCGHVNPFKVIGNWFSDAGESVADGISDIIDKGKDFFNNGVGAVGDKASSFATVIAIVAGLSIGIPIAILIGRFIKWLKNLKNNYGRS